MVSGADVRRVLLAELRPLRGRRTAVMLSGGVDSAAVLLAALAVGARPRAYSFAMAGQFTTDLVRARQFAARVGVAHETVNLPDDAAQLRHDVRWLVNLGARSKTDFECVWPFLYAIPAAAEPSLVVGSCADGHFGISKKAMIHYRGRLDEWRTKLFSNPRYAQADLLATLASPRPVYVPYKSEAMQAIFRGSTWDELNRPKQKQPIRDAWPDLLSDFPHHLNLQLGDSGIAEHFARVMKSDGYRSTVGGLNAAVREATR